MKLIEIVQLLEAKQVSLNDSNQLENNYEYVFATDLMSDALAMIQEYNDSTILITGLVNVQSLRTAEMLDIQIVLYVRSKPMTDELAQLAKDMNIAVFTTEYTMYETCGKLYTNNLKPIIND